MNPLDEVIAESLALMEGAGLRLFGRKLTSITANAYLTVCQAFGVASEGLIRRAAGAFSAEGGEFPDASRFARRCVELRDAGMVAIGVPVGDDTVRIELVPIEDRMAEVRRALPCHDSVATVSRQVADLSPRELPPPMSEAETEAERRRQLDALRGEE